VKSGRLTIDTLAGSEWALRAWSRDEPAPPAPPVTPTLDGSRLVGNAGSNNYVAAVTSGGAPGDITVGAAGSRRKVCSDPERAAEARFVQPLGGITRFSSVGGQLALLARGVG
jgi:heat shock protein HslJ